MGTHVRNTEEKFKGKSTGLTVLRSTFVKRLEFDDEGAVSGVCCVRPSKAENSGVTLYDAAAGKPVEPGNEFVIRARKEVILSGGAFNTPQLMMLSGIGPPDELNKHNIEVRVNHPGVGENLQDRWGCPTDC